MVTRNRGKPTEQEIARLARMDLWSQRELAELCTGWMPGWLNMTDVECIAINEADKAIACGTLSGKLAFVPRDDADNAAIMYGTARHYVPAVAAEWAASRFPDTFPAGLLAAVRAHLPATPEPELRTKERENLLAMIATLAELAGIDLRPERLPDGTAKTVESALKARGVKLKAQAVGDKLKAAREMISPKGPPVPSKKADS